MTVEPPPAGRFFMPRFLTGSDGRLWAIDRVGGESFVFTPED